MKNFKFPNFTKSLLQKIQKLNLNKNNIFTDINESSDMTNIYNKLNVFSGDAISIPLYIFERIFTQLHYGEYVNIPYIFLFELFVGYVTYGTDRLFDAYSYKDDTSIPITYKKEKLYDSIIENENIVIGTLLFGYFVCLLILTNNKETNELSFILLLNVFYKQLKTQLGIYKSLFIGIMWSFASVIVPCIMYSHNYDILNDPLCYLPPLFTIVGSSNVADIVDIDEDKQQCIYTIPVVWGKELANYFTIICMLLSSIILLEHPNFDKNFFPNILFEMNNVGLIVQSVINIKKLRDD